MMDDETAGRSDRLFVMSSVHIAPESRLSRRALSWAFLHLERWIRSKLCWAVSCSLCWLNSLLIPALRAVFIAFVRTLDKGTLYVSFCAYFEVFTLSTLLLYPMNSRSQ